MFRRLAAAGCLAVLASTCSEPPVKERAQAEGALAAARAAGAATYAPEELQGATAALAKYDDAVTRRDYRQALNSALDARDRAYEAAKQSANAKAAARSQAERLVADVTTLSATAGTKLSGPVGGRPAEPAAEKLRAAMRSAGPALQEAGSLLNDQDYRGAIARLAPVAEALKRELSALDPPGRRRGR